MQSFGGAQLAGRTLAESFTQPILRLELDSMDFLDIVMELRKRHGIEVPEADYMQLASLDSSAEYLTPKFNALGK